MLGLQMPVSLARWGTWRMCINNKTPHHALGLPDFSNSHPGIIYKLSIVVNSPFVSASLPSSPESCISCMTLTYIIWNVRPPLQTGTFSSVQSLSPVWLCDPMNAARQASLSPTPGVHSNSHALSRWYHPAISSSVIPFSSCPQSLPASESFPMSQHFTLGGQSTGVSALASFVPKNTQDWAPLEWTDWLSLQSKALSRVFSNTTVQKHQFFSAQLSSQSNLTSIHDHWKNHSLD